MLGGWQHTPLWHKTDALARFARGGAAYGRADILTQSYGGRARHGVEVQFAQGESFVECERRAADGGWLAAAFQKKPDDTDDDDDSEAAAGIAAAAVAAVVVPVTDDDIDIVVVLAHGSDVCSFIFIGGHL